MPDVAHSSILLPSRDGDDVAISPHRCSVTCFGPRSDEYSVGPCGSANEILTKVPLADGSFRLWQEPVGSWHERLCQSARKGCKHDNRDHEYAINERISMLRKIDFPVAFREEQRVGNVRSVPVD